MKINEKGYWEEVCNHHTDQGLANAILNLVEDLDSVVDFGCGDASYVRSIKTMYPNKTISAYDGNPNVVKITNGLGTRIDLSEKFYLGKTFDLVMSLEVAEHIPPQYESNFIQNLIVHSNSYLLISWAVPGQGGKGHVNEQPNEYVISLFENLGFEHLEEISDQLRNCISNCTWFTNTLFLFKKINHE